MCWKGNFRNALERLGESAAMYQSCLEVRVPSCQDTHVLSCSMCQSPALSRAADGTSKRAGLRAHTDSLEPLFPPHDRANSHRTHELSPESLTLPHGGEGFIQPVRRGHPPQHRASVRTQRNLCLGPKPLPRSQPPATYMRLQQLSSAAFTI